MDSKHSLLVNITDKPSVSKYRTLQKIDFKIPKILSWWLQLMMMTLVDWWQWSGSWSYSLCFIFLISQTPEKYSPTFYQHRRWPRALCVWTVAARTALVSSVTSVINCSVRDQAATVLEVNINQVKYHILKQQLQCTCLQSNEKLCLDSTSTSSSLLPILSQQVETTRQPSLINNIKQTTITSSLPSPSASSSPVPVCRPSCCPRAECNKQTCPGCYKKMVTSPEQCPCVNTGQNNHWTQMSFDVWCLLQVHFLTELMDQQDWTATLGTSSIETTLSWTARITDSTLTRVYFWVSCTMMRIRVKINIHLNNKYKVFMLIVSFLLHLVFIFNILVLVLGPGHVQTVKNCFSAPVTREQGGGPEDYICHLSINEIYCFTRI